MSTYKIVDLQTDDVVAESQTADDLQTFANDLFWQDDVDFTERNFEETLATIRTCDYEVENE